MDHLIYPDESPIAPLKIPIVTEEDYDGGCFFDYPKRRHWDNGSLDGHWSSCPNDRLAERVQVWLFFGTLSEFCGRIVRRSELCEIDAGGKMSPMNTEKLPQILWAQGPNRSTDRRGCGREQLSTNLDRLLVEASQSMEIVDQRISSASSNLSLISSSVRALLQTLISARVLHDDKAVSLFEAGIMPTSIPVYHAMIEPGWKAESFHIRPGKAIKISMKENGWCPAQISHLSKSLSHAVLYYLSGLPRGAWRHMDHSVCNESQCPAMNITQDDYIQRHAPECDGMDEHRTDVQPVDADGHLEGGCTPFVVDPIQVASIIETNNGVPLLSCFRRANSLETEVIRAEIDTVYIAISHVWAGGMGNPERNALPTCQIERISSYAHALLEKMSRRSLRFRNLRSGPHQVNFWIDTLCIPVPGSLQSARDRAVDLLPKTYSNAKAVLVLDPELQTLRHSNMPIERVLAQIMVCPWMSRCWTLREATLSRSWYIQFADGTLHAENALVTTRVSIERLASAQSGSRESERRHLLAELARPLLELDHARYQKRTQEARRFDWSFKILEEHQGFSFAQTWNNLLDRATSRMSDAHPILAGMQDISCAAIRPLTTEGDRMKAILKAHATLPVDLLFSRCAKIPGVERVNAWAPMYPQGQRLNRALGSMRVYADCLLLPPFAASRLHICTSEPAMICTPNFRFCLEGNETYWAETLSHGGNINGTPTELPIVIMSPKRGSPSRSWYSHECVSAVFSLRRREQHSLWLEYEGILQTFSYDRSQKSAGENNSEVTSYPLIPAALEREDIRVFVNCSLDSWPTVSRLYDSPEGPLWKQPAGHILMSAYILIRLLWTISFVVIMIVASKYGLARLPIGCFYVLAGTMSVLEISWFNVFVLRDLEREAWVANATRTSDEASYSFYELMSARPSLLLGPRRAVAITLLAILFFLLGIQVTGCRWALWSGIMVTLELFLRTTCYALWIVLPRWSYSQRWLLRAKARFWPRFRDFLRRSREVNVVQDTGLGPYRVEEDVPENAAFWHFLRTLFHIRGRDTQTRAPFVNE